jgi:hypothetical protein
MQYFGNICCTITSFHSNKCSSYISFWFSWDILYQIYWHLATSGLYCNNIKLSNHVHNNFIYVHSKMWHTGCFNTSRVVLDIGPDSSCQLQISFKFVSLGGGILWI